MRTLTAGLAAGLAAVVSACGTAAGSADKVSSTTEAPPTAAPTSESPPLASTVPSTSLSALPTSGPPEELPVSASDVVEFENAFSAYNDIPLSDIAGVVSGSTYEAYVPSTRTYWATARFTPSATAGQGAVHFQDGGGIGIFTRSPSSSWVMTRPGLEPFPCPDDFPSDVQALWGLSSSPYCSSESSPSSTG